MDVVINGRFLTHPVTGVQRYATEIVTAIDRLMEESGELIPMTLAAPARTSCRSLSLRNIQVARFGTMKGHAWEQVDLHAFARKSVLLNLTASGPVFHKRSVTVIPDATAFAAPAAFGRGVGMWYRTMLPMLAKRAVVLASISRFSESEIRRYMGVERKPIQIWSVGCDHVHRLAAGMDLPRGLDLAPGKYVVAIASEQANKNIAQIDRISTALQERFGLQAVVIGGRFRPLSAGRAASGGAKAIRTGYLSDGEMLAVLRSSLCLVFPSYYEGFGIPPIEAMALGVPAVVANTSSLPEACGDAAAYFEYDDDAGVLAKIGALLQSPDLARDFIARGIERSKIFRWESTAQRILAELARLARPVDTVGLVP